MKIAKRFRWEGAHRLPWHEGLCKDLHGHSYTMFVEVEGEPDENGLLMDFKHLKNAVAPLITQWDHSTLVAAGDEELLRVMRDTGWRHAVLPYDTTAENICLYVADYLLETSRDLLNQRRIHTIRVRVSETETCYAQAERRLE